MKTYDSFQAWYKDQPANQKRLITKLRKLINEVAPQLIESSKWTNGVWLKGELPIIYVHTEANHIQLGFFAGATLSDPKKLLGGKGKFVRHIRIDSTGDIDEQSFGTMIRKAVKAPPYK